MRENQWRRRPDRRTRCAFSILVVVLVDRRIARACSGSLTPARTDTFRPLHICVSRPPPSSRVVLVSLVAHSLAARTHSFSVLSSPPLRALYFLFSGQKALFVSRAFPRSHFRRVRSSPIAHAHAHARQRKPCRRVASPSRTGECISRISTHLFFTCHHPSFPPLSRARAHTLHTPKKRKKPHSSRAPPRGAIERDKTSRQQHAKSF